MQGWEALSGPPGPACLLAGVFPLQALGARRSRSGLPLQEGRNGEGAWGCRAPGEGLLALSRVAGMNVLERSRGFSRVFLHGLFLTSEVQIVYYV